MKLLPEIISAGEVVGPLCLAKLDVWFREYTSVGSGNARYRQRGCRSAAGRRLGVYFIRYMVVGRRRARQRTDQLSVFAHNFTNEGGAFGTIRFLKNVMGLWILNHVAANGASARLMLITTNS